MCGALGLPLLDAARGVPWTTGGSVSLAVFAIAAALLSVPVHARRAHKMFGPVHDPPVIELAACWGWSLLGAALAMAASAMAGVPNALPVVWLAALGAGYRRWGLAANWPAYAGLGRAMIAGAMAAAVIEVATGADRPSSATVVLWYGLAVVAGAVVAWRTNRALFPVAQ